MNGTYALDKNEGKLMGVCAGLARWSGLDPLAVRLMAVIAVLIGAPIAILLYLVVGFVAETR